MMKKNTDNLGFTLIEMMVSVTIFTIVAVVVSVGFVNLSLLNKKAQVNRALIDNVNLAMDVMVFKIKEGVEYNLSPNPNDGDEITITDINLNEDVFNLDQSPNGKGCITMNGDCLTSPEVDITTLQFKLYDNGTRDKVGVRVRGTIEYRQTQSDFSLQTNISQRNR